MLVPNEQEPTMAICNKCGIEYEQSVSQARHYEHRCKPCKNAYNCQWRRANPERVASMSKKYWKDRPKENIRLAARRYQAKIQSDPEHLLKKKAWRKLFNSVKAGKISRLPCEVCGDPKVDAHHADYSKPLEVRWLCRQHHTHLHKGRISIIQHSTMGP